MCMSIVCLCVCVSAHFSVNLLLFSLSACRHVRLSIPVFLCVCPPPFYNMVFCASISTCLPVGLHIDRSVCLYANLSRRGSFK